MGSRHCGYRTLPAADCIYGAYWYCVTNWSFGFSARNQVRLCSADTYGVWGGYDPGHSSNHRLSWHMHYWYTAGWRAGYVHYMNGERNVYKLVFTKQCNGCGKVPTAYPPAYPPAYPTGYPTAFPTGYPTRFPTAYPTRFPTGYPTRFPTAYPTRYPTRYPTTFPTSYPTPYPTAFPTPTCATTCSLKKHFNAKGGKFGKKIITVHDRDQIMYHHNHDQHRCYVTAAGKCKCICKSLKGGSEQQFHRGALTGEKAAGSLTLAGYAEGTKYHKAITVFNDGCGNVNLGKYRIDIYHNGGIKRNFYINLPNKILKSGKSFNICNSISSTSGYSKAWKKACGQYSKYLQHTGNDVIELYRGKDLIYTIGGRGYDKTFGRTRPASVLGPASGPRLGTA